MRKVPIPANENERLAALRGYHILDTPHEKEFDRITQVASMMCGTPISLITLVDRSRQWFKSATGTTARQTHRNVSFCQYTIMDTALFEVTDAWKDERFKYNPLVASDPYFRFYAGHPLVDPNGYAIGSLCVVDTKPNKLNNDQKKTLQLLAEVTIEKIAQMKEKEDLREQAIKKLEEAAQAKSNFLMGMSHEIRTPLNGIIGFTDLVLQTPLDKTQQRYLNIVHQSASSLLSIMNDILDFARIETGSIAVKIDKADIFDLAQQAVDSVIFAIQQKGLKLVYNVPKDLPRFV